jgi:hypothetical protein
MFRLLLLLLVMPLVWLLRLRGRTVFGLLLLDNDVTIRFSAQLLGRLCNKI